MPEDDRTSRRERERQRHRDEILSVALKLFSDKGFHDVSMQEIAAASEFATGTLYNFFASKEALFDDLVEASAERIVANMVAVLDQPGTEEERLALFFRSLPAQLEEHAPFIKLYVAEVGTRGAKVARNRAPGERDVVIAAKIRDVVEAGIRKGLFRPVDVDVATVAINSTLETLAFRVAGHFDRGEATALFEKVEQPFLGGLLRPEEPRP